MTSPCSWSSGSVGSKRYRSPSSGRDAPGSIFDRLRTQEATQTESQESNAYSMKSFASTEETQVALCSLTEVLFASLLDVTLQRVLQTEAEQAPNPAASHP